MVLDLNTVWRAEYSLLGQEIKLCDGQGRTVATLPWPNHDAAAGREICEQVNRQISAGAETDNC